MSTIYPHGRQICSTSCHVNYCFAQSDTPPLVRLICERLLPANMFYSTQLKDNTEDNTMKYQNTSVQNTSVQITQRMNISKKTHCFVQLSPRHRDVSLTLLLLACCQRSLALS